LNHPRIKPRLVGSISATESNPADDDRLTQAHVHTLVALNRRRGQAHIPYVLWQQLWPEVCPGFGRDLLVEHLRDIGHIMNVANYVTKDAEYEDVHNRDGILTRWSARLDEHARFITEVMQTSHQWRFYGRLRRPRTFAERMAWTAPWDQSTSSATNRAYD